MDRSMMTAMIAPTVAPLGLEVDRIDILSAGKRKLVRVRLDGDGPSGTGPDMDQIAAASRAISAALDDADMGSQPYVLEVSSRGVDAPLTSPAHFRRNRGHLVNITLVDGGSCTGHIVDADAGSVTVEDADQTSRVIALVDVKKAVVQVEFNRTVMDDEED